MMPKESGGVVDNRLKVYGAVNIRVVDASIFSSQVSGQLSSTVYAVAEKAVELIKEDVQCIESKESHIRYVFRLKTPLYHLHLLITL